MLSTNETNNNDENDGWIDSRVRRPRQPAPRQNVRHCSYCKDPNHVINFCNHPSLHQFELELMDRKEFINTNYLNESLSSKINYFETSIFYVIPLERSLKKKVRAFATSKCGSLANKLYYEHFKSISKYIWYDELEAERIIRQNEVDTIINLLNINPTELNRETIVGNNGEILGWIDRSPDTALNRLLMYSENLLRALIPPEKKYMIQKSEIYKEILNENIHKDCSICYEEKEQCCFVKLNCEHEFCGTCVKTIIDKNNKPSCAFCRTNIEKLEVYNNENEQLFVNYKK